MRRCCFENVSSVELLPRLILLFWSLLAMAPAISGEQANNEIRIGLTPVILVDRTSFLNEWQRYLANRLGRPVRFVQRQTYRQIVELLHDGDLDAAWLCGYPYVRYRDEFELLAVPVFRGHSTYHSYLIVPAADHRTRQLSDLQGKIFAYSDPDSNSGYLYPQVAMIRQGIQPRYFFSRTFFTWSHRDVVRAVADGVADAGAVDGYVWETLARNEPDLVRRTRIVSVSPPFGFPPLVIRRDLPRELAAELRSALVRMQEDSEGSALLRHLNLDGFTEGRDSDYDRIAEAADLLEKSGETGRYQLPR